MTLYHISCYDLEIFLNTPCIQTLYIFTRLFLFTISLLSTPNCSAVKRGCGGQFGRWVNKVASCERACAWCGGEEGGGTREGWICDVAEASAVGSSNSFAVDMMDRGGTPDPTGVGSFSRSSPGGGVARLGAGVLSESQLQTETSLTPESGCMYTSSTLPSLVIIVTGESRVSSSSSPTYSSPTLCRKEASAWV